MSIWLGVLLVASISCIFITNYYWVNTPEFWNYGKETGDLLRDLSIGFIGAFIFYLVNIWYPNKENRKRVNRQIALPLSRLLYNMKNPIEFTVKKYSDEVLNISKISPVLLKDSISKVNVMKEKGPMTLSDLDRNTNFLDYLFLQTEKVNLYSKQLYELPLDMDVNLISIIDRIRNSEYHQEVEVLKKYFPRDSFISPEYFSESFPQYLELYKELHKYMKKNKIEFTISDL